MASLSSESSSYAKPVKRLRGKLILPQIPPLARFVIGLAILAPFSVIAFVQPPRQDPLQRPGWFTLNWWRYPLEWNAQTRLPTLECSLRAIQAFPDSTTLWAVGNKGVVLNSVDGGKSWTKKGIESKQLGADYLLEPRESFTPARRTPTPTPTPSPSPSPTPTPSPQPPEGEHLIAVDIGDYNNISVVSNYGKLYRTRDGGTTWDRDFLIDYFAVSRSSNSVPLRSLQPRGEFLRAPSYLVVTGSGHLYELSTDDLGSRLMSPQSIDDDLNAIYELPAKQEMWITATRGRVFRTSGAANVWITLSTQAGVDLYGAFFTDEEHGWVVGSKGSIFKTVDSGSSWTKQSSGTTAQLNGVTFLEDGQHGWVVGNEGVILETSDGGATWVHRTLENSVNRGFYWRFPAPWYFVGLFLVGLFVLRKPKLPEQPPEESIADVLISDRPVEEATGDVLAFNNIASGLSRFLRNENTNPPLTIAITGEWGTGKSSLMNLVRADLRSYKFRPVWFNAWHHQKEEQMFAALLDSIKLQAVPRWWTTRGILFRARLLKIRGARHWLPLLLLLSAIYVLVVYYSYADPKILTNSKLPLTSTEVLGLLPALAGVLTLGGAIWRGMSAFGLKPATLIAGVSGGIRIRGLEAQTGFRQRFANQFNDVTRALGKRSLLIFIDDLDRCRPENVLETLEAVNFLTTSGECFVIIGMAREYVERCVGRAFNEVAQEMVDSSEGNSNAENVAKQRRIEFARQYLDKLINIEVPVPAPKQSQSFALLIAATREAEQFKPTSSWQRFKLSIVTIVEHQWKLFTGILLVILLGILGHNFARQLASFPITESRDQSPNTAPSPQPSVQPSPVPTFQPTPSSAAATPAPTVARIPSPSPSPDTERPNLISGARDPFTSLLLPLIALFAVIAIGSTLLKKPGLVVKDSPKFVAALQIWHPLLFGRLTTPRATKRFMNFVRYLAMRQRRQSESQPPMTKFLQRVKVSFLGSKTPDDFKDTVVGLSSDLKPIPDEALVALAALQQLNPAFLIERPGPVRSADKTWPWSLFDDPLLRELLNKAVQEHEAQFGDFSTLRTYRDQFLQMTARVHVR